MSERIHLFLFAAILTVFCSVSVAAAWRESLTFDEIVYQEVGRTAWRDRTFSVDPYNPPLAYELLALPGVLGTDRLLAGAHPLVRAFPSRMVSLGFSVWLLVLVYLCGRRWLGKSAGLFAMGILAFEPTLLGHNHYVTLDSIAVSLWFSAVAAVWFYWDTGRTSSGWLAAIAVGAAAAAKITNVLYLIPVLLLVLISPGRYRKRISVRRWVGWTVVAGAVVWGSYFFRSEPILVRHENPQRLSARIIASPAAQRVPLIPAGIRWLQDRPVPLGTYLGILKNNVLRSRSAGEVVYAGDFRVWNWSMMPTTLLHKLALPWLLGYVLALFLTVKRREPFFRLAAWLPLLLVGIAVMSRVHPLVRYLLPVIPLSALAIAGSIGTGTGIRRWAVVAGLLWLVSTSMLQFPHFLAYANELAGPRDQRYRLFTDSNLDWGQGLVSLQAYVRQVRPARMQVSYFGRDDGAAYGFASPVPYGSHRAHEICAMHPVDFPGYTGPAITVISVSNWYGCGFVLEPRFASGRIQAVIGDSLLLFGDSGL